jgi:hypothetical protein
VKTATFIKQVNGQGDGRVYRLDPPIECERWGDDDEKEPASSEYVWVSAANVMFTGPETYIFACDAEGKVTDWGELEGSFRGGLDHAKALAGAGYTIKESS